MEWKRPVKNLGRPAARLVTKAVIWVVGTRLEVLEGKTEVTDGEVEELRGHLSQVAEAIEPLPGRLDATYADVRADFDRLHQRLTAVLDAVADQHAHSRAAVRGEGELRRQSTDQGRRIAEIEQRIEAVRRELSTLRSQDRGLDWPSGDGDAAWPLPKVLNEDKLRSFGEDIRLNLGAGSTPLEGYLNVDVRSLVGTDIVADVRALPFGPGEVATMFCAHLLEVFPLEELRASILPYWLSLLKPGGRLTAVALDAESVLEGYARGQRSFEELRETMFGIPAGEGEKHVSMFSPASLISLLTDAGFAAPVITVAGRPTGAGFEMQVEARRPAGTSESGGR